MFDFDFGVGARDLHFVKAFFRMCREIGQRKLPGERQIQISEKRLKADWRNRALKIGATARFFRQPFERALPAEHKV